jgi:TolA-binding protein
MMRLVAGFLAFALGAAAPIQCAHKPDPDLRREDSPDDALWGLAHDFRARGNDAAARSTLRYLVEKYPSSRHAVEARAELGTVEDKAADKRADGGSD